jgi:predicted Zn-dependent protease
MLETMEKALDSFSKKDVSFADIRLEDRSGTNFFVTNGALRSFNKSSTAGAVARSLVDECWGTASSSMPLKEKGYLELLEKAAKTAKACSKYSRKKKIFLELKELRRQFGKRSKKIRAMYQPKKR